MKITIEDKAITEAVGLYNSGKDAGEARLTVRCVKHFLAAQKVLDAAVEAAAGSCHLPPTMWE